MNVLDQITAQKVLIPLEIFGVDISITITVIMLWLSLLLVLLFYYLATFKLKPVPNKMQNTAELVVVFLRDEVAGQIGPDGIKWLPFLVALFSFILVNNLLGLIPGISSSTANINVTAALAIIVFVTVQVSGMFKLGFINYLKSFVPEGLPLIVSFFMLPIEIVSQLAKPFSLAIRLFANMFAGHAVMLLVVSLILIFKSYFIAPLPVIGDVAIMLFEIFIAFIQAFVFTYLSALYIATALEGH